MINSIFVHILICNVVSLIVSTLVTCNTNYYHIYIDLVALFVCIQIDRLEQNCGQLQMNLAKCQAQNKEDIRQLEDHISKLDNNLRQTQARGTALEQEIARKEDQIKRYEAEIKSLRTDIANKSEEVSFIDYVIEWRLIYYCTCT